MHKELRRTTELSLLKNLVSGEDIRWQLGLPGVNPKAAIKVGRKIPTEEIARVLPTLRMAKK
jgi:hypothetical protein